MNAPVPAKIANQFGTPAPAHTGGLAQSDQQRAIAEIQAAVVVARANPRDQRIAMDRIINACTRPSLAESAVYTYARGGSDITGPSIRLAEAIAQNWGNIHYGVKEVSQSRAERSSECVAYAWDLETNTRKEISFTIPHIRHTKNGQKNLEDPRDIYELVANNGARRVRNCILAIIPGDVIEGAVSQCESTLKCTADVSSETIKAMLDRFAALGISKAQIEKRIQRNIDAMTPAQLVQMRKIYNSIKDGMSAPDDWFEPVAGESQPVPTGNKAEALKAKIAGKTAPTSTEPEPAAEEPTETSKAKGITLYLSGGEIVDLATPDLYVARLKQEVEVDQNVWFMAENEETRRRLIAEQPELEARFNAIEAIISSEDFGI